jgi:hypothetical protein
MTKYQRSDLITLKTLLGFFCLIIVTSCNTKTKKTNTSLDYNIQIEYLSTPIEDHREMYNDSLYIDFVGNYNNDTITLYLNGKEHCKKVFTTDERSGNAGYIEATKYDKVRNVGIRINNGKLIYIEPELRHYNIQVYFTGNNAMVRFYRYLPAGD